MDPGSKAITRSGETWVTHNTVAAPNPQGCSGSENASSQEHRACQWQQGGIQVVVLALASLLPPSPMPHGAEQGTGQGC